MSNVTVLASRDFWCFAAWAAHKDANPGACRVQCIGMVCGQRPGPPVDPAFGAQLQAYITQMDMRGLDAPDAFRAWLRDLSLRLQEPLMFYTASTFGGTYDYDYALTYTPTERLHATRFDGLRPCSPTALQSGLACLSITLPTSYFALHERSFDWASRALLQ